MHDLEPCFACSCGHGGHTLHLAEWFVGNDECPTGCGCRCVERGNQFYKELQGLPDDVTSPKGGSFPGYTGPSVSVMSSSGGCISCAGGCLVDPMGVFIYIFWLFIVGQSSLRSLDDRDSMASARVAYQMQSHYVSTMYILTGVFSSRLLGGFTTATVNHIAVRARGLGPASSPASGVRSISITVTVATKRSAIHVVSFPFAFSCGCTRNTNVCVITINPR